MYENGFKRNNDGDTDLPEESAGISSARKQEGVRALYAKMDATF